MVRQVHARSLVDHELDHQVVALKGSEKEETGSAVVDLVHVRSSGEDEVSDQVKVLSTVPARGNERERKRGRGRERERACVLAHLTLISY